MGQAEKLQLTVRVIVEGSGLGVFRGFIKCLSRNLKTFGKRGKC